MVHNINPNTIDNVRNFDSFKFVNDKKKQGKVKNVGFSFHGDADMLEEVMKEYADEVDFVQLQINYIDWDNPGIEGRRCYEIVQRYNKPVIVMEPVKGGSLANLPPKVEQIFRNVEPNMSPASWAIRYAASLPGVMMVLSGMSNLAQVEDNTAYMQNFVPLDDKEKRVVETAVKALHDELQIPCTACRYCVEACPMKIAIPDYFMLYNQGANGRGSNPFKAYNGAYDKLAQTHGKASSCIACRLCEKNCPQHIEISQWMKKVAKAFEA